VTPPKDILREWWQDRAKFLVREDQIYKIDELRKVNQLITIMMNLLCGREDCDVFHGRWVPIMYVFATSGIVLN